MTEPGSVNLNPSSFADDGGLLDLSMEDIVSLFQDREKRRYKDAKEDENQQEIVIGAKVTPMGLTAVITSASYRLGVSRSMLTKCLSHQLISWFDSLPDLVNLVDNFYSAHDRALSSGRPDLCNSLKDTGYTFLNTVVDGPTTFRSIAWVRNKLSNLSVPLGVSVSTLFHIGLCWSISTSMEDVYKPTIDSFLRGEADRFCKYLGARAIRVRGFCEEVDYYTLKS